MNLPDTERAYIAGLIDGEGCISGVIDRLRLTVSVQMCEPAAVKMLHRYYGGSCWKYFPRAEKNRVVWCWKGYGISNEKILQDIEPFIKVKYKQVQLGLAFMKLIPKHEDPKKDRERVKLKRRILKGLKYLNRRGPR